MSMSGGTYMGVEGINVYQVVVDQESSDPIKRLGCFSVFHSLKQNNVNNQRAAVKVTYVLPLLPASISPRVLPSYVGQTDTLKVIRC